jgi:hypothetical protein
MKSKSAFFAMIALSLGVTSTALSQQDNAITFEGGRVVVVREGNVDHVQITDEQGNLESESWCPLEAGSYDELSTFFRQFVAAVDAGETQAVAALIRYPLQVNGTPRFKVSDRQTLLSRYSDVFTPDVVSKIRSAAPEAIFCRNGQAMIGDGVIWVHSEKGRVAVDTVNR